VDPQTANLQTTNRSGSANLQICSRFANLANSNSPLICRKCDLLNLSEDRPPLDLTETGSFCNCGMRIADFLPESCPREKQFLHSPPALLVWPCGLALPVLAGPGRGGDRPAWLLTYFRRVVPYRLVVYSTPVGCTGTPWPRQLCGTGPYPQRTAPRDSTPPPLPVS